MENPIKTEPPPYFDLNFTSEKFKNKIYEAEMDLKASLTTLFNVTIDGCLEFIDKIDTLEEKQQFLHDIFIKEGIPKIVKSLLSKSELKVEALEKAHRFIIKSINVIFQQVTLGHYDLLDTLENIFFVKKSLYTMKDVKLEVILDGTETKWDINFSTCVFASNKESKLSQYVIKAVNHFGQLGGFNLFLAKLTEGNFSASRKILRILIRTADCLNKSILADMSNVVKDAIICTMSKIDEDVIRSESKNNLTDLITYLNVLLHKTVGLLKSTEICDPLMLKLCLSIFRSDAELEKRLGAISEIKLIVREAIEEDVVRKKIGSKKYITTKYMLSWMEEVGLISLMFSRDLHAELLRCAKPFLLFLTNTKGLENSDLEFIWNSCLGKHEATQKGIWDLIIKILPSVSISNVEFLWEKIESWTFDLVNKQFLTYVKEFTDIVINFHLSKLKKKKLFGITLFWHLVQDYHRSREIQEVSFEYLRDLIIHSEELRKQFAKLAMENLKDHFSVPQSLSLLNTIVITSPNFKKKKSSVWQMLDSLTEKHKVNELVFLDFSYCKNVPSVQIDTTTRDNNKIPKLSELMADTKTRCSSNYSTQEAFQARLNFLGTILYNTPFTFPQFVTIFNLFEREKPEYEQIIIFLETFSKTDEFYEPGVMEKIMEDVLIKINIEKMNLIEFKFFFTFMVTLNCKLGNLNQVAIDPSTFPKFVKVLDSTDLVEFKPDTLVRYVVSNPELIGFNHLIKIIKNVGNPAVASLAIASMNQLRKECSSKDKLKDFQEGHIKFCMKELQDVKIPSQLERILEMLYQYLLIIKKETRGHGTNSGIPITVKIQVVGAKSYKMQLQSVDPVGKLISRISHELNTIPKCLTFHLAETEVTDPKLSFIDLHFKPQDVIFVKKIDMVDMSHHVFYQNLKKIGMDPFANIFAKQAKSRLFVTNESDACVMLVNSDSSASPVDILQRTEYFSTLFSLLDEQDSVAKQVWNILFYLPTNESMSRALKEISSSSDWSQLLSDSPHKLLYQLQIVNSLSQHNNIDTTFNLESWIANFHSLGALDHLIKIFITRDLSRDCLILLVKILNTFLKTETEKILDVIVEKILTVGVSLKGQDQSEVDLLTQLLTLLKTCMKTTEVVISEQLLKWFTSLLLESKYYPLRAIASSTLSSILAHNQQQKSRIFLYFYNFIQDIQNYETTCDSYFGFLNSCLKSPIEGFQFNEAMNKVINRIKNRPIKDTMDSHDPLLIGYLTFATHLFACYPELKTSCDNFIPYVFNVCLFDVPKSIGNIEKQPPKCKSRESRAPAYDLLLELALNNSKHYQTLLKLLDPILVQSEKMHTWHYTPDGLQRVNGFVGLRNLGATCYMNSLMQQFFHTSDFRASLLKLKPPTIEELKQDENVNLLYQMQLMFANMQESVKRYYDTKTFATSYRDFTGEAINTSQQQDVNEFYNLFTDKIEAALRQRGESNLIKEYFGGRFHTDIITAEHTSSTSEPFLGISLEVKNKKNIQESLELYIQGEKLQGENKYYDSNSQKYVDALKRSCIKELPQILILHLKRFEYDYERKRNLKINDRLEFSQKLDMFPYTYEAICQKEGNPVEIKESSWYHYELVGVLVHMGTADSGHYYSYIKDKQTLKWFEFNDIKVEPFNVDHLEKECFGDEEEIKEVDKQLVKTKISRSHNAYMLFYERVSKATPQTTPFKQEVQVDDTTSESMIEIKQVSDAYTATPLVTSDRDVFDEEVPGIIKEVIVKENSSFWRDNMIYHPLFYKFVWNLLQETSPEDLIQTTQFACKFIIEILAHSKDVDVQLPIWTSWLCKMFDNVEICKWFLTAVKESNWKMDLFLASPLTAIRSSFCHMALDCIKKLGPYEEYISTDSSSLVGQESTESYVANFVVSILALFSETRYHYKHIGEIIQLLTDFAELGYKEKRFLLSKDVLCEISTALLGSGQSATSYVSKSNYYGFNLPYTKQCISSFMKLASTLILSCETSSSKVNRPPTMKVDTPLELSSKDKEKFFARPFIGALIQEYVNLDALNGIFLHWCWENKAVSHNFSDLLIDHITDGENLINSLANGATIVSGQKQFTETLEFILDIDDSIRKERTKMILDNMLNGIKKHIKNPSSTYTSLSFILAQSQRNAIVKEWLYQPVIVEDVTKIGEKHSWKIKLAK